MKGTDADFHEILDSKVQFRIPVFQRDYLWEEPHCAKLFRDILRIGAVEGGRPHFIGSVVSMDTGETVPGFSEWIVIDGQQRLTTITLLAAAIRDHIRETGWAGPDDGPNEGRLNSYFLRNEYETGNRRYKLVLRGHDDATLRAVVDGRVEEQLRAAHSERILASYHFFREELRAVDPAAVYRGINRLRIVNVTLHRDVDDAQLVFESMNSTGLSLSKSDLIRNYLLMNLDEQQQSDLYDRYWKEMEDVFRGHAWGFDGYFRAYVSWRTRREVPADTVYAKFRHYREDGSQDTEELLEDLRRCSRYYAAFLLDRADAWPTMAEPLRRIRQLAGDPVSILVMRLFECHDRHKAITEAELTSCLGTIESYLLRRAICGWPPNSYGRVFANVAHSIREDHVFDSLCVALLNQWYAFPDDTQFRDALTTHDIFGKRACRFLLETLEKHGSKEPISTSLLTIEHILPRTLSKSWRLMLGNEAEHVHATWLHRLGNLTLTGYNSEYSNRPFVEKRDASGGFRQSALRLNSLVRDQECWTDHQIRERGEALAARALDIWPRPAVSPEVKRRIRELDLREEARHRNLESVPMESGVRELFEGLRSVLPSEKSMIEMPEKRSIAYFCPDFLLEVIPRKDYLTLLFGVEFGDVRHLGGFLQDLSDRTFVMHASHKNASGAMMTVSSQEDIARSRPIIQRTLELIER
ncbi:MAG: DUF262 domain-containing protein [Rhodospirillales bacterium]|nr:DUF262 domain-containing protein [Rhodospirillales bacterium]